MTSQRWRQRCLAKASGNPPVYMVDEVLAAFVVDSEGGIPTDHRDVIVLMLKECCFAGGNEEGEGYGGRPL